MAVRAIVAVGLDEVVLAVPLVIAKRVVVTDVVVRAVDVGLGEVEGVTLELIVVGGRDVLDNNVVVRAVEAGLGEVEDVTLELILVGGRDVLDNNVDVLGLEVVELRMVVLVAEDDIDLEDVDVLKIGWKLDIIPILVEVVVVVEDELRGVPK
jgi:hypothetical protein